MHRLVHLLQLFEGGGEGCISLFERIDFVVDEVILNASLVLRLNQAVDRGASCPTSCLLLLHRHHSLVGHALRYDWRLDQRGQPPRCVLIPVGAWWDGC